MALVIKGQEGKMPLSPTQRTALNLPQKLSLCGNASSVMRAATSDWLPSSPQLAPKGLVATAGPWTAAHGLHARLQPTVSSSSPRQRGQRHAQPVSSPVQCPWCHGTVSPPGTRSARLLGPAHAAPRAQGSQGLWARGGTRAAKRAES